MLIFTGQRSQRGFIGPPLAMPLLIMKCHFLGHPVLCLMKSFHILYCDKWCLACVMTLKFIIAIVVEFSISVLIKLSQYSLLSNLSGRVPIKKIDTVVTKHEPKDRVNELILQAPFPHVMVMCSAIYSTVNWNQQFSQLAK